ncbi:putative permease [Escherichia coli]|uniref:Putative permease n=1 Tax=Escherichia coli TaxID=562 RepID=A0A376TN78_ECOLX|nr:putative permease [Escherichia coli]
MPSSSHPVERFSFSTALFGMLVLTLGMGLGRFLYTPMLPVMMAEGAFSFSQLSWIASGNYAGYLAGSLLFSFGAFHQPSRLRPFLLVSALASGLLILAMAWLPPFILVLLIRFLAGVASAGMLIFGSTLIMQHTRHPFVLAALFSGVGIGIALGNEYVLAGLHFALSSQTLWQGAGALSGMMLIALTLLMPSKKHAIAPMPLGKNGATDNELVVTGYSVRPGGIWLYHRRDLPAAHGERCRLTIVNRPSLDVSRLINCARLL